MQHPGPPRFIAVGESLQLSPRDPDPEMSYQWYIERAPASSTIKLPSEEPVVEFAPDTPGTFQIGVESPVNDYSLTIRVFPGSFAPITIPEGESGSGGVSGHQSGSAQPVRKSAGVSGSGSGMRDDTVERGRPRIQLQGDVAGDELVITADAQTRPDNESTHSDIDVEFLIDDRDDVSSDVVSTTDREMRIPLEAVGRRVRIHAVAVTDVYSVPDSIEFTRDPQPDGGEVVVETETPAGDTNRQTDIVESDAEQLDISNRAINIRAQMSLQSGRQTLHCMRSMSEDLLTMKRQTRYLLHSLSALIISQNLGSIVCGSRQCCKMTMHRMDTTSLTSFILHRISAIVRHMKPLLMRRMIEG